MASGGQTGTWLKLIVVGLVGSSSAMGDGFCCLSAPKNWQYRREVCFGHYQTKWRRWDEVCAGQSRTVLESPLTITSTEGSHLASRKPTFADKSAPPSLQMSSMEAGDAKSTVELAVPLNPIESTNPPKAASSSNSNSGLQAPAPFAKLPGL